MEHFTNIEKRLRCDIGRSNGLHPPDGKWRVGKEGFNKDLKLNDMIELAYTMENPRPNIVIKGGKNAKWYLKNCLIEELDQKIERAKCNGSRIAAVNRAKLYIV